MISSSLDWQRSDKPDEMWAVVKGRATERQCRFFVEACEAAYRTSLPTCGVPWTHYSTWKERASEWVIDKGSYQIFPALAFRASVLREVFGDPFRPYIWYKETPPNEIRIVPMDSIILDPAWLTWNNGTIPALAAAVYPEEESPCKWCEGTGIVETNLPGAIYQPSCSQCGGQGKIVTTGFDRNAIPVLADALEEARCTDPTILSHLRGVEKCPWCSGGDVPGNKYPSGWQECSRCNGTGVRCVEHHPGCWVVELFLNK